MMSEFQDKKAHNCFDQIEKVEKETRLAEETEARVEDLKHTEAKSLRSVGNAALGRAIVAELDSRLDDAKKHRERANILFEEARRIEEQCL